MDITEFYNEHFSTTKNPSGTDIFERDYNYRELIFFAKEYHKKQLSLCSVVRSKDVQLMRDSMLKSREETAKAREYSAIKQTLDIYCNDDELPTVNEVLERIGRKH